MPAAAGRRGEFLSLGREPDLPELANNPVARKRPKRTTRPETALQPVPGIKKAPQTHQRAPLERKTEPARYHCTLFRPKRSPNREQTESA